MFENDPMMKELHEIRKEIEKETKGLTSEQKEKIRTEHIKKLLQETGYKLIDLADGTSKLVRVREKILA